MKVCVVFIKIVYCFSVLFIKKVHYLTYCFPRYQVYNLNIVDK